MTRKDLCWSGGMLFALGAAVWLWGENRELRGRMAERDSARQSVAGRDASASRGEEQEPAASGFPSQRQDSSGRLKPQPRSGSQPTQKVTTGGTDPRVPGAREARGEDSAGAAGEAATKSPGDPDRRGRSSVVPAAEAEKLGLSLFKNGGFDKELAPWTCEGGRVVQEPGNPENSVLETTPGEGALVLSQDFQRSVASRELVLTFHAKSTTAGNVPIEIRERLQNGKELPIYSSIITLGQDRGRTPHIVVLEWSGDSRPIGLVIKCKGGEDPLWLDNVVLREVKSTSFAPGK